MQKIYLATSITNRLDANKQAHPEFKDHIEAIAKALEAEGFKVFCAIRRQNWTVAEHHTPSEAVTIDLSEIDASDILLAILHEDTSSGVQYEIGHAAGSGKTVILVTEPGDKIAFFNQGLIDSGKVGHIVYQTAERLSERVEKILSRTE